MLRAVSLNMAVKKNSTKPIDPSNLLSALKPNLSSTRVTPFEFNSQQVSTDIQTSLKRFLSAEIISSEDKLFCPSCKTLSEGTRETCVMNSAPIFAIKLFRFSNRSGQLVEDETLVSCTQSQLGQYLTAPITIEDEVAFISKYSFIATIYHYGTLRRENYWVFY